MICLVVVVDEAGRHTMEAADKSREGGMIVMPIAVPNPPGVGGVKSAPETSKESP